MSENPVEVVTAGNLPADFLGPEFAGQVHFRSASTDDELRRLVREADVLYSWRVPEIVPAESPRLRWVQLPSAGADHLRGTPVWDSDVILTSSRGAHTVPMSEHFMAMLLALTRRLPELTRAQEVQRWTHERRGTSLGLTELRGRTLGIVGWGKIGDGIAHLARAFGMRVIGTRWSIVVPREVHEGVGAFSDPPWVLPANNPPDIVYPAAQLHEVLAQSDAVVLVLPLTAETQSSFGAAEFAAMRPGSLFFNIGRGGVVDEAALLDALTSGRLGGAGLDVFAQEPLPRTSPLWSHPHVIISPHVGGVSDRTRQRTTELFGVNLTRYLSGQSLLNVVDRGAGY
ncbi:MAG TPA: D-2-hydroxyacid dehydrogenase [Chloroflexota bacterium]|nr:D-2-hydroxyacid dehydrogenase [Chloroflexota bacterium]